MRKYRNSLDLTPFYRSTVGFDRVFDVLENHLSGDAPNYPRYNIIQIDENQFMVEVAVAGFNEDELDVTVKESVLVIQGTKVRSEDYEAPNYLHKGIAVRDFKKNFNLGEHVEVLDAVVNNGLLTIKLAREVPEEAKAKKIQITYQK